MRKAHDGRAKQRCLRALEDAPRCAWGPRGVSRFPGSADPAYAGAKVLRAVSGERDANDVHGESTSVSSAGHVTGASHALPAPLRGANRLRRGWAGLDLGQAGDVAQRIVQPPRVGSLLHHRMGLAARVLVKPSDRVELTVARCGGARAAGVLPLRFGRQAQPQRRGRRGEEGLHVVPRDPFDGPTPTL